MRRLVWLALALPALLLPLGCSGAREVWDEPGEKKVVVTIAPLASFVKAVAGDRAAVKCLCTVTGPHHYETDYRDARLMDKADIVFSIGLELDESFANSLVRMAGRFSDDLPHIKLGEAASLRDLVKPMRQHKHAPGQKCDHHHGDSDPHLWLGLDEAAALVDVIRAELSKIDPDHAAEYKKNATAYAEKLGKLRDEARTMVASKKTKRIISFHDAFGYFAAGVGLEIVDVIELGPGQSPSAWHLAQLEKPCLDAEKPIGAITVEPQYPDSTSASQLQKALRAKGVSVPLVSIDPLETADRDELKREGAGWYEKRMRQNILALDKVLK